MNYRHAFHAGNFADVLKHAVLALAVTHLKRKDKPFVVIDTHAGIGSYDLTAAEALRTGEALHGVSHVVAQPDIPDTLAPYLDVVRALNGPDGVRWYPGSPRLARDLLRSSDRLVAVELHPKDAEALAAEFGGDRRTAVHTLDGWLALKSFLPPKERRGLVLVDPPFERPGEFDRMLTGLKEAQRRWATGILMFWYPIKSREDADTFTEAARRLAIPQTLLVELAVAAVVPGEKLSACGLLIVNPPWRLDSELRRLLPWLQRVLARGPGAGHRLEWLVGERPSGQTADNDPIAHREE